jgi:hypothetical protein
MPAIARHAPDHSCIVTVTHVGMEKRRTSAKKLGSAGFSKRTLFEKARRGSLARRKTLAFPFSKRFLICYILKTDYRDEF